MSADTSKEEMQKQDSDKAKEEEASAKKVSRLLFLVDVIAIVMFAVGAVWVTFMFPQLSSGNYFSENALIPGAGSVTYRTDHAQLAMMVKNRLESFGKDKEGVVNYLVRSAMEIGLETTLQNITIEGNKFSIVVAVHHAPRGEGKECVVLTARYPDGLGSTRRDAAASTAVLMSLMDLLATVPWLSKDIIMVATPASVPGHAALDEWLLRYHARERFLNDSLPRGGDIWAALALSVPDSGIQRLALGIEGMSGQLPNLDLVNVAVHSSHRSGFSVTVPHRERCHCSCCLLPTASHGSILLLGAAHQFLSIRCTGMAREHSPMHFVTNSRISVFLAFSFSFLSFSTYYAHTCAIPHVCKTHTLMRATIYAFENINIEHTRVHIHICHDFGWHGVGSATCGICARCTRAIIRLFSRAQQTNLTSAPQPVWHARVSVYSCCMHVRMLCMWRCTQTPVNPVFPPKCL
jgi:hypothetical protein